MSYYVYTTEAVILKKTDVGEADSLITFFAKEFGKIMVLARGVRYIKSKHRYNLSGFSLVQVSVVGTSNGYYRLTDAREIRPLACIRNNSDKMKYALRLLSFMSRLIQGEERDERLWNRFISNLLFLEEKNLDKKNLINFDILSTLHILAVMGYLIEKVGLNNLTLRDVDKRKNYFVSTIKEALEYSQL